jgi:hypothetical protein
MRSSGKARERRLADARRLSVQQACAQSLGLEVIADAAQILRQPEANGHASSLSGTLQTAHGVPLGSWMSPLSTAPTRRCSRPFLPRYGCSSKPPEHSRPHILTLEPTSGCPDPAVRLVRWSKLYFLGAR